MNFVFCTRKPQFFVLNRFAKERGRSGRENKPIRAPAQDGKTF